MWSYYKLSSSVRTNVCLSKYCFLIRRHHVKSSIKRVTTPIVDDLGYESGHQYVEYSHGSIQFEFSFAFLFKENEVDDIDTLKLSPRRPLLLQTAIPNW